MPELRDFSIWAVRVGLVLSFIVYYVEVVASEDGRDTLDTLAAAITTAMLFAATFVPDQYYNGAKGWLSVSAKWAAVVLFLAAIAFSTATAAVMVHNDAVPKLSSRLGVKEIFVVLPIFGILLILLALQHPSGINGLFPLGDKTTPARKLSKSQTPAAAAKAEDPVAAKAESPVAAKAESPVAAKPKSPVAAKPKSPVAAKPKSPVVAKPKSPVAAKAESPIVVENEGPVAVEDEGPVAVEDEGPVAAKGEDPVVDKAGSPVAAE